MVDQQSQSGYGHGTGVGVGHHQPGVVSQTRSALADLLEGPSADEPLPPSYYGPTQSVQSRPSSQGPLHSGSAMDELLFGSSTDNTGTAPYHHNVAAGVAGAGGRVTGGGPQQRTSHSRPSSQGPSHTGSAMDELLFGSSDNTGTAPYYNEAAGVVGAGGRGAGGGPQQQSRSALADLLDDDAAYI